MDLITSKLCDVKSWLFFGLIYFYFSFPHLFQSSYTAPTLHLSWTHQVHSCFRGFTSCPSCSGHFSHKSPQVSPPHLLHIFAQMPPYQGDFLISLFKHSYKTLPFLLSFWICFLLDVYHHYHLQSYTVAC